jgi:hypothetical protein
LFCAFGIHAVTNRFDSPVLVPLCRWPQPL